MVLDDNSGIQNLISDLSRSTRYSMRQYRKLYAVCCRASLANARSRRYEGKKKPQVIEGIVNKSHIALAAGALQKIVVDAPNFVRRKRQTSGLSAGCTHCWNNAQKFRARHDVLPAHLIFQRAGTAARLAICEPSISEGCASQKTKMTTTEKQG